MATKVYEELIRETQGMRVIVSDLPDTGRTFWKYSDGVEDNPRDFLPPHDQNIDLVLYAKDMIKVNIELDPHLRFVGDVPKYVHEGDSITVTVAPLTTSYLLDYWSDKEGYDEVQEDVRTFSNITEDINLHVYECENFLWSINSSGSPLTVKLTSATATVNSRRCKMDKRRSHEEWDGSAISVPGSGKLWVARDLKEGGASDKYDQFSITGGNCTITGDWFKGWIGTAWASVPAFGFYNMFKNCTTLKSAADTSHSYAVGNSSFRGIFYGCTGLTTAPRITPTSAKTWGSYSFAEAFRGCTSLSSKGNNNFKNVTSYGTYDFYYTFYGCNSITANVADWFNWSVAPATECFWYTFGSCLGLKKVGYNYDEGKGVMWGHTNTLSTGSWCYESTFRGCTNLQYIYVAMSSSQDTAYRYMCYGCTSLMMAVMRAFNSYSWFTGMQYMFNGCKSTLTLANYTQWSGTGMYEAFLNNNVIDSNMTYVRFIKSLGTSMDSGRCAAHIWDHYDYADYYRVGPIFQMIRTSWSSSGTWCDWFEVWYKSGDTRDYYYDFKWHSTGWVARWNKDAGAYNSTWSGFSTSWQANKHYMRPSSNGKYQNLGEHRNSTEGTQHWSSADCRFQFSDC